MRKNSSVAVCREKEELLDVELDPGKFNEMFNDEQTQITRISKHLFNKYPCADCYAEAFNILFVGFVEQKVFQRWSVARVVRSEVRRRTKDNGKAENVYRRLLKSGNDEAERVALEMGIDLKVKRGQFLYKWIEHIFGEEYLRKGNHSRRFTTINPEDPLSHSWSKERHELGFIPWASRPLKDKGINPYEGSGAWGVAPNHESKLFPTYEDTPLCVGEHSYSNSRGCIDDELHSQELEESINEGLTPIDKFIVSKRFEGYNNREIQESLMSEGIAEVSSQCVQSRLSKINPKRTTRLSLKNA